MENIWTEINNEVPKYMETICRKYDMKCEKVGDLSTMMYNNKCCLVIEIDRFYADFFCVYKSKDRLYAYQCGNYLEERFDEYDRQGLIHRAEAGYDVRNSLTVISRGLINKCEDILLGDTAWIEKYKQSSRFLEVRVPPKVAEILNNLGDFCAH